MIDSPFPICDECGTTNAAWDLDGKDLCAKCYGKVKGYYTTASEGKQDS